MKNRAQYPVYLDFNATTPLDPVVVEAMQEFISPEFGNPSSTHFYGIAPRRAVNKARRQVAEFLNCSPSEIVFTGCATESNNLAIKGISMALKHRGNHIITTRIEHPAVLEVCAYLRRNGFEASFLPVDEHGLVDVRDVERAVCDRTILISVMHANNEVGTIQPIEEIAEIARSRGIIMHTDAAQTPGKVPVDVKTLGVDLLTIAGHKLYAPKGVGALYLREGIGLEPILHGAGQERGMRPGTENVIGIVGLGMACELAAQNHEQDARHMQTMRDLLHTGIEKAVRDVRLNGHPEKRLPNTLSLSFRGSRLEGSWKRSGRMWRHLGWRSLPLGEVTISHVLAAMQVPGEWARGTLRLSTGRTTTREDVIFAARVIADAVNALRSP